MNFQTNVAKAALAKCQWTYIVFDLLPVSLFFSEFLFQFWLNEHENEYQKKLSAKVSTIIKVPNKCFCQNDNTKAYYKINANFIVNKKLSFREIQPQHMCYIAARFGVGALAKTVLAKLNDSHDFDAQFFLQFKSFTTPSPSLRAKGTSFQNFMISFLARIHI